MSSMNEAQQRIDQLSSMVVSLYQSGQYEEAIKYATQSVDLTRHIFGEQHPDFAQSLNNLAGLYYSMGDYAAAEPLHKQAMEIYRVALGEQHPSQQQATNEDIGIQLREAIFTPLLKAIGNRKRLLISPDGDLSRLPFEVLPAQDGRRLIDEYRISYLGAGRDVVRFDFKSNREPARSLVAADPDFDFGAKVTHAEAAAGTGRRSLDLKRDAMRFNRLPGTRVEGQSIASMLDAELWTEDAALDARLKRCRSPRILHLATHGFFLEDQKRDPNEDRFGMGAMSFSETGMERLTGSRLENPLLRSGLALAGVNTWLEKGELMEEAEDGLLTAEDVSGLDLLDTELVVLSACETGLGEVRTGEGVFGLRRAFVLAGARTLVMSLWKVPDEQTQELMEDFYRRILAGQPRADALREAQLAMKAKHPEPKYWGAFICDTAGEFGKCPTSWQLVAGCAKRRWRETTTSWQLVGHCAAHLQAD